MLRAFGAVGLFGLWGMLLPVAGSASGSVEQKIVAGVVEPIAIGASGVIVDAKLDTGADSCSLHAVNIQDFERDGAKWVRFDVAGREGKHATIEAPVVRTVRIKRGVGSSPPRPVVRLSLCLANVRRDVDVNLTNRSRYAYPALVGRNFLSGYVLVDSARERTTQPECAPPQ